VHTSEKKLASNPDVRRKGAVACGTKSSTLQRNQRLFVNRGQFLTLTLGAVDNVQVDDEADGLAA
jgi:hypothetical protein